MDVCIQKYMRYLSNETKKIYFNMKGENSINTQCCKLPFFFLTQNTWTPPLKKKVNAAK